MDTDHVAGECRQLGGGQHYGDHRSGRNPIALRVIQRGEGIAISLLFAELSPNRLRVALARKSTISASGFGYAVHPVSAVTLRQQPSAKRNLLPSIFILPDHAHASTMAPACQRSYVQDMFPRMHIGIGRFHKLGRGRPNRAVSVTSCGVPATRWHRICVL